MKQIVTLPVRNDRAGSGYFGAPRGARRHNGIDYVCHPGEWVLSPVAGVVSKHGYPYSDDLSYEYVEVTDARGLRHRVMYVKAWVSIGAEVVEGAAIGRAQDVSLRYPGSGMLAHVHYEVINTRGEHIDPSSV